MTHQDPNSILNGLRVLDFTWMVAGPYATRLLADFGAEVLKVQSKKTAYGAESNLTEYFAAWNRNKRSLTLDLSHPEARDLALKLVALSDMVVENFSPRVMSNWGLDYRRLKEVRKDLIMISISAMGQSGPWKDYVAYGPTLHAFSGLTYLTSYSRDEPIGPGHAYGDFMVGLYAVFAALAALEFRAKTGEGQHVDLSGFEAVLTLLGPSLLDATINQREAIPKGNRSDHLPAAPYGCYPCKGKDTWCAIATFSEKDWEALCQVLGHPAWTAQERFSCLSKRKENEEELDEFITQWTVQYSPQNVLGLLRGAGVPSALVKNAEDLTKDPHLLAREFFFSLDHPLLGSSISTRSPMRFKDETRASREPAPLLGEDNRYVFMELLGLTESDLLAYAERGIIG